MSDVHQIDPNSRTWKAVERHADSRIVRSRATLESHGTTMETTEYERGRIDAMKELLRLAEDPSESPLSAQAAGKD